jgi:hypothetical protein
MSISPGYLQTLHAEFAQLAHEQNEAMATGAFILMCPNDWEEFERRSIRRNEISALLGTLALDTDTP